MLWGKICSQTRISRIVLDDAKTDLKVKLWIELLGLFLIHARLCEVDCCLSLLDTLHNIHIYNKKAKLSLEIFMKTSSFEW